MNCPGCTAPQEQGHVHVCCVKLLWSCLTLCDPMDYNHARLLCLGLLGLKSSLSRAQSVAHAALFKEETYSPSGRTEAVPATAWAAGSEVWISETLGGACWPPRLSPRTLPSITRHLELKPKPKKQVFPFLNWRCCKMQILLQKVEALI